MNYDVRLTRFIETPGYRHRLQLRIRLAFVPFVGLEFHGCTATPAHAALEVVKVVWNIRDDLFEAILSPKQGNVSRAQLQANYGSEWTFTGIATT